MVVFLLAPLAAYGAMWGVHAAAAAFVGVQVASGQMAKKEARNAFKKDINPLRGGKKDMVTFELPESALPPAHRRFARKYVMTEKEMKDFDEALCALTVDEPTAYDFDWMMKVQDHRIEDRKLVQN